MIENNLTDAIEQAASTPVQEVSPEVPAEQPVQEQREERYQSRNFRELREKNEQIARERDEAIQRAKAYETQLLNQQQNVRQESSISGSPDDLIDRRTFEEEIQRRLKPVHEELQAYKSVSSHTAAETRLRYDFPDIDSIVTAENIQKLKEEEPHLAASIASSNDVYTAGAAAYRALTRLGIADGRNYTYEKKRAQENLSRPRPVSTVTAAQESPLVKNGMYAPSLTTSEREAKYQKMRQILDRR